jgi:hypothetical protein
MLETNVKANGIRLCIRITAVIKTKVSVAVRAAFGPVVNFWVVTFIICEREEILGGIC